MKKYSLEHTHFPLLVLFVSVLGSMAMQMGMPWYSTLALPSWTPEAWVISLVWFVVYGCVIMSLFILGHLPKQKQGKDMTLVYLLFVLNLAANIFWSFLFFKSHDLFLSTWDAAVIGFSVCALILVVKPISHRAALYLFPYAIWITFVTYLTYSISLLN